MKHPIPLRQRVLLLAQWPFSSSARETWYLLRTPANAAMMLKGFEEADAWLPPGARILGPKDFKPDGTRKERAAGSSNKS